MENFLRACNQVAITQPLASTDLYSRVSDILATTQVTFHKYQLEGICWMMERWNAKRSVIVADEMGLGKTLQTLGFLKVLLDFSFSRGPFLVIAPLSVAPQWHRECVTKIPTLSSYEFFGSAEERRRKEKEVFEFHYLPEGGALPSATEVPTYINGVNSEYKIIVSTYETVLSEIETISRCHWGAIVFDEGHRLKNDSSVTHTTFLEKLRTDFKIILTGTPIQNKFEEFWSLLHFLYPHVFTPATKPTVLGKPLGNDDLPPVPAIQPLIATVMLRRLFKDVASVATSTSSKLQLPAIKQYVVRTGMTKIQADLYKWALVHYAHALGEKDADWGNTLRPVSTNPPQGVLSNLMMTLRKISSHPYLVSGVEPEPFKEGPHIWQNSNKLTVLKLLLDKMRRENSRALIFSNFTSLLDICQDFLDLENIPYERLDGSVRGQDRVDAVARFESNRVATTIGNNNKLASAELAPDKPSPTVFLLSTRAGGVGLNLTSANWVIFLDSDWNPQMDLQAIARAHRQGQTKPVSVYRIVTAKTIDEIILARTVEKLQLARSVLSEKIKPVEQFTTVREIRNLVAYGLSDLIKGGDAKNISLDLPIARESVPDDRATDIESLIERIEVSGDEEENAPSTASREYKKFEGVDYGVAETGEENVRVLDSLVSVGLTHQKEKLSAPTVSVLEEQVRRQEARQLAEQIRAKRKMDKWKDLGYETTCVPATTSFGELTRSDEGTLVHVTGSVVDPVTSNSTDIQVIVHIADSSGIWPTNSALFAAIAQKFPNAPTMYHLAKEALDLHLGDVHVFKGGSTGNQVYLGLLICYRPGDGIDFDIFKKCLNTLSVHFSKMIYENPSNPSNSAVVFHFTRLGDERGKLYITEKLIERYCCDCGFLAYMYYYRRASETGSTQLRKRKNNDEELVGNKCAPPKVSKIADESPTPQVEIDKVALWVSPKIEPPVLVQCYAKFFNIVRSMQDAHFVVLSATDSLMEIDNSIKLLTELCPGKSVEFSAPRLVDRNMTYIMTSENLESYM